jgi:hypothetical protein
LSNARPEPGASPFLFVVGCPRSGTTLLQRMLDHHSLLAVANDTHFIPRCLEKTAPLSVEQACAGLDVPLTIALVDAVVGYHRFHRLGLGEDDVRSAASRVASYGGLVAGLYDRFARSRGKRFGGEKTPDYVRRLRLLSGLFPQAKIVHIVRDGRDVALSVLDWADEKKGPGRIELWHTEPLATCALWWRWQVLTGTADATSLPQGSYHELRYEHLVADPNRSLTTLSAFLGIPMCERMLTFHQGRTRFDPGASAKSNWLPPVQGLRDWRRQMSARDVELFEALAGDLLQQLGYERTTLRISPSIARRAADCSEHWARFLDRRSGKAKKRLQRARRAVATHGGIK